MSGFVVSEECWRRLDAVFAAAAQPLRECNPALWFQTGRRSSDRVPLDAWAEFGRVRDPARTEDIVVFVAVVRDGGAYRATVDISTGEGVMLADGPARTLRVGLDVLSFVTDVESFLADRAGLLRAALC
ncbi:MAG TPA: hypothetical protein VFE14_08360 [Micromonosporaceae bacterium]|jgi:hypothetical protein|nr:hypothetical protein [Micromonosporaceae bacterium]